jgi:Tfp pilus assembly protein PilE
MILPVGKVFATVVRTWCRPVVNKVVLEATEHESINMVVMFLGRQYLRTQRLVVRSEAAGITNDPQAAAAAAAAATSNGAGAPSTALDAGSAPPAPAATAGTAGETIPLTPAQQAAEADYREKVAKGLLPFRRARRRPVAPEPTKEEIQRAGAFVLVEMFVYGILIALVYYEYRNSTLESRAKTAAVEARFQDLERKLEQLEATRTDADAATDRALNVTPSAAVVIHDAAERETPTRSAAQGRVRTTTSSLPQWARTAAAIAEQPHVWMVVSFVSIGLAVLSARN